MRLTGGDGKGRILVAPPSFVRPTSARTREILFQILMPVLPGARVLDLFAGAGMLGLEALARGADTAVFVEKQGKAAHVIQQNIERCGFAQRAQLVKSDAIKWLERFTPSQQAFDIILADPPYKDDVMETLLERIRKHGVIASEGQFVFEAASRSELKAPEGWVVDREKKLGDTKLIWLSLEDFSEA